MCQLSLPAESLIVSYSPIRELNPGKSAETSRSLSKAMYKMRHTSAIVLGVVNAFALAPPSE